MKTINEKLCKSFFLRYSTLIFHISILSMFFLLQSCNDSGTSTQGVEEEGAVELAEEEEEEGILPPQGISGAYLTGVSGNFKPAASAPADSVAGARIYVLEDFNFEAYTNEAGSMSLELEPGTYTLLVLSKDSNWGVKLSSVVVKKDEVTDLGTTFLQKTASLSGIAMLYGKEDHTGIELFIPGTGFITSTNQDGSFVLSGLPEGKYDLRVEKSGYNPIDYKEIELISGEDTKLKETVLSLSLGPEGEFEVRHQSFLTSGDANIPIVGQQATLDIQFDSDAVLMRVSTDSNFTNASWIDVTKEYSISFEKEGLHDIYVQFQGGDGLESGAVRRNVFTDYNAPRLESVALQYGANTTHQQNLHFELIGDDKTNGITGSGISHYQVSENSAFDGSEWIAIKDGKQFYEYELSSGDGTKTLFFRTKDSASLISSTVEKSILFDSPEVNFGSLALAEVLYEGMTRFESDTNASGDTAFILHRELTDRHVKGLFAQITSKEGDSKLFKLDDLPDYIDFKIALNSDGYAFAAWIARGERIFKARAAYYNPNNESWKYLTELEGSYLGDSQSLDLIAQDNGFYFYLTGYRKDLPEDHAVISRFFSLDSLLLQSAHLIQDGIGHIVHVNATKDATGNMTVGFATEGRGIASDENNFRFDAYAISADKNGSFESSPKMLSSSSAGFATAVNATSPKLDVNKNRLNAALWCENDSNGSSGDTSYFLSTKVGDGNWGTAERIHYPITVGSDENSIKFKSDAGVFEATVEAKTYKNVNELISALSTSMNAADTSHTYSVNENLSKGRISLSVSDSSVFELHFATGNNQIGSKLGFNSADLNSATTYEAANFYQPEITCNSTNHWIAVDNTDAIHIIWSDASQSKLYYSKKKGSTWTINAELIFDSSEITQKGTIGKFDDDSGVFGFYTKAGQNISLYALQFDSTGPGKALLMDSFKNSEEMIRTPEVRSTKTDDFTRITMAQKPQFIRDHSGFRMIWTAMHPELGPEMKSSILVSP